MADRENVKLAKELLELKAKIKKEEKIIADMGEKVNQKNVQRLETLKRKHPFKVNNALDGDGYETGKGDIFFPLNMQSSSLTQGGYINEIKSNFKSNIDFKTF